MKLGKVGRFIKRLMDRYRYNDSKKLFACYMILHTMVVLTAVRCLITHNYESFAICILTLVLFLLPALVEEYMDLTIPPLFQTIIFLFIFSAEILGEVNSYYVKIPGWDTMLHTMNGFLCAAIGFSLIYLLNRGSKNVNLSPFYLTLVAFCFSMTIGVTFSSVNLDPQNSGIAIRVKDIVDTVIHTVSGETITVNGGYLDIGILDTMKDLLVNLIGAVVFSVIGYITLKKSKTSKVAEKFMIKPNVHEEE